jgi:succinate dehydrogenase / fumarate reductase cytochrome b subunit
MSEKKRPYFLNLFLIRMPVPAMMSIAHRLSGVVMVLAIPVFLYLLELSLANPEGFHRVRELMSGPLVWALLFLLGWGLVHHLFSGIRFLLIDFDYGLDRKAARMTAWVVILGAVVAALLTGMLGVPA